MHRLELTIRQIIAENDLPLSGRDVVIGVSGGPDSMALLHILASLRNILDAGLHAVYVDHGLRPEETGAEIALVRKAAQALGLSCRVVRVDAGARVREQRLSLEHGAREVRYQALSQIAGRLERGVICVGHTADDQVEEILIRLIRGSGRSGLSGMRPVSGRVVRPLLGVTRDRILAYLKDRGIEFCVDSSNRDLRFLRNRVRHELLPFLEQRFDHGIRKALLKTASSLAEDEVLLDSLTGEAWDRMVGWRDRQGPAGEAACVLERDGFRRLPSALQRRLVERILWRLGSRARYAHIITVVDAAIHGEAGRELHLSRGLRVGVRRDVLEFSYPRGRAPWRGRLADTP
ncbi:MAG TPA: tRNA lysidine(34) synthetase TilS [Desulfobulbus sp.]|nr:tRNA lysidine(34) synthetase TilS [Desulfobulbus sp.]